MSKVNNVIHMNYNQVAIMNGASDADVGRKQASSVSGICAFYIPAERLKDFKKNLESVGIYQEVQTHMIMVIDDYMTEAKLTEEELEAIMLHEEGHIELKHLDVDYSNAEQGIIIDNNEAEKEADQYAISKGASREILLSAISKLIAKTCEIQNFDLEATLIGENLQDRLNQLRAA